MEFKVYQKELELQSRGWIPTFHDVSSDFKPLTKNIMNDIDKYRNWCTMGHTLHLHPISSTWRKLQ